MIDYEKLQTLKSRIEQGIECLDSDRWPMSDSIDICRAFMRVALLISGELIAKYGEEELTQPNPKYKKNDEVWVNKLSIFNFSIVSIEGNNYYDGDDWYTEDELYPTKFELIQAQVAYWEKLALEEMSDRLAKQLEEKIQPLSSCCSVHTGTTEECREECEHEFNSSIVQGLIYKCKKCGEFYR